MRRHGCLHLLCLQTARNHGPRVDALSLSLWPTLINSCRLAAWFVLVGQKRSEAAAPAKDERRSNGVRQMNALRSQVLFSTFLEKGAPYDGCVRARYTT